MTAIIDEPMTEADLEGLAKSEDIIAAGLHTFVEVGRELLRILNNRWYRKTHDTWADYLEDRWNISRTQAHRLMVASEVVDDVTNWEQDIEPPARESTAREVAKADKEQRVPVWRMAQWVAGDKQPTAKVVSLVRELMDSTPTLGEAFAGVPMGLWPKVWAIAFGGHGDDITTAHVREAADVIRINEVATSSPNEHPAQHWIDILYNEMAKHVEDAFDDEPPARPAPTPEDPPVEDGGQIDKDCYSTPQPITDLIWKVQKGGIDLDPCTHEKAQKLIKARLYYYREHDGLGRDWLGCVWMNPPYSNPVPWVDKLLGHMRDGDVPSASVLTNCDPSRPWYMKLKRAARWCADPPGRIQFWHPDSRAKTGVNRNSQTLFLIGEESDFDVQLLRDAGWDVSPGGCGIGGPGPVEQLEMIREVLELDLEADVVRAVKCLVVNVLQKADGQERFDAARDASMDRHFDRANRILEGER